MPLRKTRLTMEQLILHLIGDYVIQSHWMAENKTKRDWPAIVHAIVYGSAFLTIVPSFWSLGAIIWSHYFIDRDHLDETQRVVFVLINLTRARVAG